MIEHELPTWDCAAVARLITVLGRVGLALVVIAGGRRVTCGRRLCHSALGPQLRGLTLICGAVDGGTLASQFSVKVVLALKFVDIMCTLPLKNDDFLLNNADYCWK